MDRLRAVTSAFLRAKDWQIFLLLFVIPPVLDVTTGKYMPKTIPSLRDLGPPVYLFCLLGWLWAMGSFLNVLQKPNVRLNLTLFRVALLYPALLFVAFTVFFAAAPPAEFVLPLALFALFCMLYCFYFVARSLVTVNKGKRVVFKDYAKTLFLLYFFPIGVWSIQPRINQLYVQSGTTTQRE